jgi:hypothetical protein
VKPRTTPASVVARLDEIVRQQHRDTVERLAPIRRFPCELHGWHPPGPGSLNMDALASLCPHCRERGSPATSSGARDAGDRADPALRGQRDREEALGRTTRSSRACGRGLGGSATEKLACRTIDELRTEELYELAQTPQDRRRANAEHWGRKLRVPGRQAYTSHPARAGP